MPISKNTLLLGATVSLTLTAGAVAHSQSDNPYAAQIAARHGQMNIMALNLSVVGNMARGNIEYDAAAAQTAADNLAVMGMLDGRGHWPEGSDNLVVDGTRALPAIWEDMAGFGQYWQDLGAATAAFQGVAGQGLDEMRAGIGPIGRSCGGCHEDYREPDE